MRLSTALATLLLLGGADAHAQTAVTVLPPDPARWDLGGHTGWLGGNKSGVGAPWDDWFDAWSGGASVGYYLTPHLKAELQANVARRARIQGVDLIPIASLPFIAYRPPEHLFSTSSIGAGDSYQFRNNTWFHPYVGGGLDVVRERHRIAVHRQVIPGRDPGVTIVLSEEQRSDTISWAPRPFASAGFKVYLTERAFMRSELRTSFSDRGAAYVSWSAGFGVDL